MAYAISLHKTRTLLNRSIEVSPPFFCKTL
jgi:hypothetical protein